MKYIALCVLSLLFVGLLWWKSSLPRGPQSCDYWYYNSTNGVCFIKTDGYGHRVPFTAEDSQVLRKMLHVQCDMCDLN